METLVKRDDFVRAHKQGQIVSTKGILVQIIANGLDVCRFGFTASSRLGNAVIRNRIKRRLRALVREQIQQDSKKKSSLFRGGYDYVLVGRHSTVVREYIQLKGDLRYAVHSVFKEKSDD